MKFNEPRKSFGGAAGKMAEGCAEESLKKKLILLLLFQIKK
jgi:hypothetical protein